MDETRWWEAEGWEPALAPFVVLMRALLERRISPVEFELLYIDLFEHDSSPRGKDAFRILERVFVAVDDFCFEDRLRDSRDIDADELVRRVKSALEDLQEAVGASGS